LVLTAVASADSFDKPLRKQTVVLSPASKSIPPDPAVKASCFFYADFMVKQIDAGEVGSESLSIVPLKKGVPAACSRKRSAGEIVIDPKDWSGYFKGVKDRMVFFSGDDGVNRGMGFAVFDSTTGKKIFDDVAFGPLEFPDLHHPHLTLRYTRVADGGCNMLKDQVVCWSKIKSNLGSDLAEPDCKKAYEKSARELAEGRCQAEGKNKDLVKASAACVAKELPLATQQTSEASSVIAYLVEVDLSPQPAIRPVARPTQCWPSD
jgi:hypothetical protein